MRTLRTRPGFPGLRFFGHRRISAGAGNAPPTRGSCPEPDGWSRPLSAGAGRAEAAGAAGLLAGLFVPVIGVAAGIGLVLYFTGAVVTVIRARWCAHIPFPLPYAAPVVGALVLGFTA
ncbi:DoxX family protein [Streptomyces sp. NPDC001970]